MIASFVHAEGMDKKTYLFVESASKAELADGKLVLYGVDDEVSVFSDRPYRSAGVLMSGAQAKTVLTQTRQTQRCRVRLMANPM